jgi:hypothetical protein
VDLRFLSPLFLIGLAAAAVPIVIHLFRRQADPIVPFAPVRFLRRAPVEQARRRRLREWLLLALRTLALVLLAVSFARPYLVNTRAAHSGPATVIAMDTSYSVSAPQQVERARALAGRALDEAPAGRAVALVTFDERASVVVTPTLDRAAVRACRRGLAARATDRSLPQRPTCSPDAADVSWSCPTCNGAGGPTRDPRACHRRWTSRRWTSAWRIETWPSSRCSGRVTA